jgi:hypothetical protein
MANEENKEQEKDILKTATNSPLIGRQAKPTILDSTTKLDIDTSKSMVDNIIEAGLSHTLDVSALENFTSISNARGQIYQLIDTMCQDSAVSSIVRTYSEDVCETADNGHIVWCESTDPDVAKFVNYLLNVMNVDKKIFGWTYCLIKYGDIYLRLYRESDYIDPIFKKESTRSRLNEAMTQDPDKTLEESHTTNEAVKLNIHKDGDRYSYYVEMVADPGTMFELTKFGQTYGYIEVPNQDNSIDSGSYLGNTTGLMGGASTNAFNFKYATGDVHIYQADDFVHACLEDNVSRFPETVDLFYESEQTDVQGSGQNYTYTVKRGKSLLYDAYKIWREKALLESAVLLSRITRSGIVRKVAVEVGDMSKEQTQQILRRVKEMFEQKSAYNSDQSFSEYNNPGAVDNFIYYATHEGKGAISVESVGGDFDPKQLTDLDWWNNKFYSSFGIPKQYFGWTDDGAGFNGGTSLTILSSVYAKGVKRVQNCILQMITDAINLFLLDRGCKSYLNNFTLKMRAPVTQEEISYRENFTNRVSAISSVNSLFTDVENKARRLQILKSLLTTLELGGEILEAVQGEIEAAEEEALQLAEETESEDTGDLESLVSSESTSSDTAEDSDLDLSAMPDSELAAEGFTSNGGATFLTEEQTLFEDSDDLPSPEEVDKDLDFTQNI